MSIYVINNLVHFDNEAFTLYRADAPAQALRIGAIASRCLTLLLQADGQILGKRELMSGAWGAFGLEVTENSLAQVVRQLRVALEKLQADPELILTVPRIGYRINERVELLDAVPPAPLTPLPAPEPEPAPVPIAEAPPVSVAVSVAVPAPVTPSSRDWLARLALGLAALTCWAALFQLPGLLLPATLPAQPFVEARVEQLDGVTLHLEDMPGTTLRPANGQLVAQAKQLGLALGMDDLHLYRFTGQERSLSLLCRGELRPGNSHCLGLQTDE
jgi:DNA-binding winged helix-turn-helix (wHTH) protein